MITSIDRGKELRHYKGLKTPIKAYFMPLRWASVIIARTTRRLLRRWFAAGLLATTPVYADGISGTYVGTGAKSAFLVQIVETTGGQLTGRYEQTVLEPSGKLNQMTASMTGAADGQTIVVTIKPNGFMGDNFTTSGTIQGSILHLTGGGNSGRIDLNLSKSDEAAYRTDIADLTNQARAINEAKVQADQLVRLNELTKNMLAYSSVADAQLEKFPPIEQRYRAITEWMNAALSRQQSIYGGGQASLARGQMRLAINQAGMEGAQLHSGLQVANQDVGARIQALIKSAVDFNKRCQLGEEGQRADLRAACFEFFDATKKFKQSIETLGRAFDQAEKIWLEERRKQENIIQVASQ